jgi:hypothetical protein
MLHAAHQNPKLPQRIKPLSCLVAAPASSDDVILRGVETYLVGIDNWCVAEGEDVECAHKIQ